MNIDLDDRAWFDAIPVGGIGVHVVEGAECSRYAAEGFGRTVLDCPTHCQSSCQTFPPPEWVALSEQKCETCKTFGDPDDYEDGWCMWVVETTDGDPTKIVQVHSEHGWRQVSCAPDWNSNPCPDCLGSGSPLVRVTVPCGCNCHEAASPDVQAECVWVKGCDSGRVSIGSVTVEAVVPIVDAPQSGDHLLIYDCRAELYRPDLPDDDGFIVVDVDLGPNPEQYVGKYGVIIRRVA